MRDALSLVASGGQDPHTAQPSASDTDSRDANLHIGSSNQQRGFVKKLGINVLLDQKAIWTSPFHIDRSSAKWWMSGVVTAWLLAADHPISQVCRSRELLWISERTLQEPANGIACFLLRAACLLLARPATRKSSLKPERPVSKL